LCFVVPDLSAGSPRFAIVQPHPEEPRSGVSKKDPVLSEASFETDLTVLLRMTAWKIH
jgi:hypothetical protein